MDLSLSEVQQSLREAYADMLATHSSPAKVREAEVAGFDPALWTRVVGMGLESMGLPEEIGGDGAPLADLAVIARVCGAHLASVPFVERVVAGRLLAAASAKELLDGVPSGEVLATLVPRALAAEAADAVLVPAGAVAELVVVLQGDQLVALKRAGGARPHSAPLPNFGSQPLATWDLADSALSRTVLVSGDAAVAAFERAVDEWRVLTAAALDGLRASALDIGVRYVKQRKAFGVPIGSFQAVQHRLADMSVAGDGAELLVHEAAWAADTGQPEAATLAAYALLFSGRTAFQTCREALQFHGGYGVALEYDIQLYFRRAKAWPLALGDPAHEEQRVAQLAFATDRS